MGLTHDQIAEFVASAGWKFASSMPHLPHEYVLRGKPTAGRPALPVEQHDAFAAHIAEHGYEGRFFGRSYRYFDHDGWKYWVVDDVINRERLPEEEPDAGDQA
jgi:hypothetical protein